MKLERFSLANFRGFEQLDLDFEEDVTLLAGVNGVGKSSLLQALAGVLSRALPEFTPSRSPAIAFTDDDIRGRAPSLEVSARVRLGKQLLDAGVQRLRSEDDTGDRFILLRREQDENAKTARTNADVAKALHARTLTGDLEAGVRETRAALAALKGSRTPALAVYFTAKRQLPGQPRSLPAPKLSDAAQAYSRALHDREVELREFMHWFRSQEALGASSDPRRLRVLDALRGVVKALVPEFANLRVEERPRLGFVVEKRGHPLYLHQLSDGERGLLALVFDLTRRLAIANPDSDDPISEAVALVLIDEIELHLHPKWQRDVLGRLRDIFKRCQFVVTTHSPLVLGEVEARCVRYLEYDGNRVVARVPSEAYGLDANRILQEQMGARIRNRRIEADLNVLFELIDAERLDEARAQLTDLKAALGHDEPELTRADALIHFLAGED